MRGIENQFEVARKILHTIEKEINLTLAMVFVEVFVIVTVAAVVGIEAFVLRKICKGEEVPYFKHGPLFVSRGEALALMASK